jgi:hypothetical protein
MAGSRTLKLSILADVEDLKKKLGQGSTEVQSFGSKLGDFSKKAGLAFAAAGAAAAAYAGKLLVDGVQSAIADEKAQERLAATLKNVTGATNAQIKATENYILKTSLAKGITDDELRPSLDRLVKSTNDVKKAQELQTLAIDIAAGSGKSLETVSAALGKAYDGNTGALARLGVGLSAAELKSKSFDEITAQLSETFKGQGTIQAETFAGKMDRLKIAFDEGKETVGSFVLDAVTPMVDFFVKKVVPAISDISNSIGKNLQPAFKGISEFFTKTLIPAFETWWEFLTENIIPGIVKTVEPIIQGLFKAFDKIGKAIKENEENLNPLYELFKTVSGFITKTLGPAIGTVLGKALEVVGTLLAGLITGFSKLVRFIDGVVSSIRKLINLVKNNPLVSGISNIISNVFGGGRATGGPVQYNTSYMVGENGPEIFVPNTAGRIIPNNKLGGNVINITVNGAVDPVSTARQIAQILKNEASTAGTFANLGVSRFAAAN